MSSFGLIEENMELSLIHLAVCFRFYFVNHNEFDTLFFRMSGFIIKGKKDRKQ